MEDDFFSARKSNLREQRTKISENGRDEKIKKQKKSCNGELPVLLCPIKGSYKIIAYSCTPLVHLVKFGYTSMKWFSGK